MNLYLKSMIGGFLATVVLSLLMMLKAQMGLMPGLNVITMLSGMLHTQLGIPASPAIGWLMHFAIGTVMWGLLFAFLYDLLPGRGPIGKGMAFGCAAWLMMMVLPMPMAGAGFFGLKIGMMAPVMTLILHIVWGWVLGMVVGALPGSSSTKPY
ncbi:DUF6789 family protein [Alcanivorax sp. 24]|uniref:DUF6789 family protein n=1 Tax=Alcanivorax sp. 24 TaxID=2545266 RepID=UPI00105ECA0F|nr:DUF6789 family protein [Alcanivorax sp. 24]